MRSLALIVAIAAIAASMVLPVSGQAANCGTYLGSKIVTHGGLSCARARTIYAKFKNGYRLPSGWVCGLSAGRCDKGSKGFTFRFN